MQTFIDQAGHLIRTPATFQALQIVVQRELEPFIDGLACEDEGWRASGGVSLTGVWRATAEPVLLKLGLDANQHYWTEQLATTTAALIPRLYASGAMLGDWPLNWVVLERVPFGSLGPDWQGAEFTMVLDAAVRFQQAAQRIEPRHVRQMDVAWWRRELTAGVAAEPPGPVATVLDRLEADWAWLTTVCPPQICHGDAHMTNVVSRTPPPQPSQALLIDCQPISQPWPCEAAYLQVLNSIDRARVGYRGLVAQMAQLRLKYGLPVGQDRDLAKAAQLTLAWYAIRFWGMIPQRHTIADYRAETERYIRAGAGA